MATFPQKENSFNIKTKGEEPGLTRVRNAVSRMAIGDYVIAALKGNRVARLGEVTDFAVKDEEWDPLVPKSKHLPIGQDGPSDSTAMGFKLADLPIKTLLLRFLKARGLQLANFFQRLPKSSH